MENNNNEEQLGVQHEKKIDSGAADFTETVSAEKKDRFLPISILIAAIVIAGAVLFATFYRGGSPAAAPGIQATTTAPSAQAGAATAAQVLALGSRDAILGNQSAPVTIVEYGDYQCPFCARYFSTIQPQIVSGFINSGKAKMVFRDFPFLGPESESAAEAAQCAEDQNKLWAYHDALYMAKVGDENKGGTENDGFYTRALFIQLANQVGLNVPTFTSCIDTGKDAAVVAAEKNNATIAGVNSTPITFVNGNEVEVNGQSAGADPTPVLQAIQAAVAQ